MPHLERVSSAVFDGVEIELFIDHREIMRWLGPKAAKAKGGKARQMNGCVVAKRKAKSSFKNLEALFKL